MFKPKGILIIVILLIVGIIFYYFVNKNSNPPQKVLEQQVTVSPVPTKKSFVSSELGISFEHPETWQIRPFNENGRDYININTDVSNSNIANDTSAYYIYLSNITNTKKLSFEDYIFPEDLYGKDRKNLYSIQEVNGLKIYKSDHLISQSGSLLHFITPDNVRYIRISLFPYYPERPVVNQDKILESLENLIKTIQFI
ncbi:hypothetical protein A2769_02745 [Candidatus Daviesbacteria bacterium RIFCSPHIGHO2_01_FULL_37_27]|nr:MAG: hypothetical protein A2769_02745 [Candidatus Daviesbacteria bacterium RIFCSPHIGHO2_01_FULL_37_27]